MTDENKYVGLPAEGEGVVYHIPISGEDADEKCPFCMHTTLLRLHPKDRQRVAEYLWNVLLNDLYEIARDTEDHKEIWALDHRVRTYIRATRVKE